ncbi:MAG: WecB/TagA/CpsF family glycosyltransferase [Chloroflexi bacterium]|nr:WecB/TagA/CpsF family glycosyltransferase [Chloroflexota bacterium]MBI3340016.1 WecB/TagA/CpsF family glycosyltransferase [Chloroflexota bacterium]
MTKNILGIHVNPTSYMEATRQISTWAKAGESRYVCAANVHMVMEAYDALDFRDIVNAADLVTPDGMPLVWILRRQGNSNQTRVYGPDLTLEVIAASTAEKIPVGFYGGTPDALDAMICMFKSKYPALQVAYAYSPPFRPLTVDEDADVVNHIKQSGARIIFVGLGCPRQERWMAAHKGQVLAVMLGVGAAFDFHSGSKRQAPKWMQAVGLEWLFRLIQEPQRLWRRYFIYNSRFIVLALRQLLRRENDKGQR